MHDDMMAAIVTWSARPNVISLLKLAVCSLVLVTSSARVSIPDVVRFNALSTQFDQQLTTFLQESSGYDVIEKAYRDTVDKTSSVKILDGSELVEETAKALGDILQKKIVALQKAAKFAEDLTVSYPWSSPVQEVDYVYAKDANNSEETYMFDKLLNDYVSYENSSVHIPIDIYRKDVKILHTLAWTSDLDQIWRQNREADDGLSWQYFGSQTGVLRTFPASKWKEIEEPDLYDVRRRPWYTQGASSPKEMLILIDTSGSCHGQALALMKHSINSIIDTLSENDFVNVANFSDKASVVGCFQTFVQANPRNKKKLMQFVEKLHANGVANYHDGFQFAFEQFLKYNKTNKTEGEGANCNQMIMFLTDGGTEKPEELFKKYNPDKKIRIFSYAVGPIANPKAAVKWIGCYNRGYYYEIPAMGAIRSTVQAATIASIPTNRILWSTVYYDIKPEYSRLLDKTNETVPVRWSTAFQDAMEYLVYVANPQTIEYGVHTWTSVYLDKLGLGLVTSATMPVFNRSEEIGNQTLLGVVGIDIPLSELTQVIPQHKFGPGGYAFITNPNGNIVYHPNLKTEGEYAQPPSIDLVELEEETPERLQVRKEMIDQITNSAVLSSYTSGMDDHHAEYKTRRYYYTGIPNSNFSLAFVLPDETVHYIENSHEFSVEEGVQNLKDSKSALIIDLSVYCGEITETSNLTTPLEDFIDFLQHNSTECDTEKVQALLFDLQSTQTVENWWSEQRKDGVLATLVEGNRGFIRLYPQNVSEHFQAEHSYWKDHHLRRTRETSGWMLTSAAMGWFTNTTMPVIIATKAVSGVQGVSTSLNIAVAGSVLSEAAMSSLVTDVVAECANASVDCYLVDDGGFVVFHNDLERQKTAVGGFFGSVHVEPELMIELVNNSVYVEHVAFDFQGTCYPSKAETSSSAFRLMPFYLYELLSLNWWTATYTWTYTSFVSIYTWLCTSASSVNTGEVTPAPVTAAAESKDPKAVVGKTCIRQLHQYHFSSELSDAISGSVRCTEDCSRSYVASKLSSHNLLLVVIQGSTTCPSSCSLTSSTDLLAFEPEEKDPFFASDRCEVHVRYRRRPPCYEDKPSEQDSYCAGCSVNGSLLSLIVAALLSLLAPHTALTWS